MKSFFLTLSIILSISSLTAQGTVKGILSDKTTKEIIAFATVICIDLPQVGATTNDDGTYKLQLPSGKHTIKFSYLGYSDLLQDVEIRDNETVTLDVAIESTTKDLGMVVVSEGKYAKRVEESTVSVEVIKPSVIASNNVTSLDQVIAKAPGVQVLDGQVNIRGGAGYAYGAGSRVMFLVDEQPLLSAELSDVKWNFVPIENTGQIEIIKGAASVLYGSGALNGVINFRTAFPESDKPYTSVTVYGGLYNRPATKSRQWWNGLKENPGIAGLYFATRRKLLKNKSLDFVLGANVHRERGYIKGNDESRFRLTSNLRWHVPKTDGRVVLGLNTSLMYHEQGTYFLWKDGGDNAFIHIDPGYTPDRYLTLSIDPYAKIFDKHKGKHEVKGRFFMIDKIRQPSVNSNTFMSSIEYQYQKRFADNWQLTAGTLNQYYWANSILFNDPSDTTRELQLVNGLNTAIYTQVEKRIADRLDINIGGRWESFKVTNKWIVPRPIFRAGLNYKINSTNYLRASYGQGYRYPSFAERFINETISGVNVGVFPNPDLKPESGWSSEIGYKRTFFLGENWKGYLDGALYWMEYNDMIDFKFDFWSVPNHSGLGFRSTNIARARIAGFELSTAGEGKIGEMPLRIWGGYNFSYAGDLSADTLQEGFVNYLRNFGRVFTQQSVDSLNSSILLYRNLHTARIDVETEWKGFTLGAAANYTSFMLRIDPALELFVPGLQQFRNAHPNGDWVFDLRLGYRFGKEKNNHINFIINNLLNREYALRPARMSPTRAFTLKFKREF